MAQRRDREKYYIILDAATRVFAENGFYASQVSKIAREAGVADGTIYLYFKSKEEILIRLFQERMGEFFQKLRAQLEQQADGPSRLRTLVEMHFDILEKDLPLARVMQIELRQVNPVIQEGISGVVQEYFRIIEDVVVMGQKRGEFRQGLSPKMLRQVIFGSLDEVATAWTFGSKTQSLKERANQLLAILLHGIQA